MTRKTHVILYWTLGNLLFSCLPSFSAGTNNPAEHLSLETTQNRIDSRPSYRWEINESINNWDAGIPLGNGLTGCLVWGQTNTLQFGFDRGDIWENRSQSDSLKDSGLTYEIMQDLVDAGELAEIKRRIKLYTTGTSADGRTSVYSTKLPGARLELEMPSGFESSSFQLDMGKGLCTVTSTQGVPVKVFTSASTSVTLIKCEDFITAKWFPAWQVWKLGYPTAEVGTDGDDLWFKQKTGTELEYGGYAAIKKVAGETLIAVSFTSTADALDYMALAKQQAEDALAMGYESLFDDHKAWWLDFWSKSDVTLPEVKHERFYHLVQYLYGAGSRKDHPPLALQGLWTAANGRLPPWKGDYHNDLNVQMTYWSCYTSGRFEQGRSLINFYTGLTPTFVKFAKDFFDVDGIMFPTIMGQAGQALGGWPQYSLSPVESCWTLQNFYWQWKYTMDFEFLQDTCYPFCKGMAEVILALLEEDENGKLKMPLSSSPELFGSSARAWMTPNSNNDLAIMTWLFNAMHEMADTLGLETEATLWQDTVDKFDDLAVDARNVLKVSPDRILSGSHRHPAHLMSIYPLGLVNIEGSEADREVIFSSLDDYPSYGVNNWKGYTFAWCACMEARAGRTDKAFTYLDDFVDFYVSKNGFHLNSKQRETTQDPISMTGPFTLEGNFGASQAIHEMLLQSWGGTVRIFPSLPTHWKDLSFDKWHTEGGFIVSAEMKNGETVKTEIYATVDRLLRIRKTPHNTNLIWNRPLQQQGDDLVITLNAGETLLGSTTGIKPNDPNIHIDGINYPVATDDELRLIRFNPTPTVGNALSAPCATIFFQTDSPTVTLNFKYDLAGGEPKKIFYVYQDGVIDGEYTIPETSYTGSVSIASSNAGLPVTYRVVYPIFGNPVLTNMILDPDSQLSVIPDSSKPVYVSFGDSITHGTGQNSSYQGYAYQVSENFGWELYNCAVGGSQIFKTLSYAEQLKDFPKVDYITLLYGYNDLMSGSRSEQEYADAYRAFVDAVRRSQPYADLFCITLTATGTEQNTTTGITPDDFRAVVAQEVNDRIDRGDHHIYLIHGDQVSNTNDVNGGVHFTVEGAARFATNLMAKTSTLLNSPSTPEALPVWATNLLQLAEAKVGVSYSDAIYPGLDVFDHQEDELIFTTTDSLPEGLSLQENGKIAGIPTAAAVGTTQFVVKAEDGSGNSSTATIELTVRDGFELGWVAPYDGTSSNTVGLWHMNSSELGSSIGELQLHDGAVFTNIFPTFGTSYSSTNSSGNVWVAGSGTNFLPVATNSDLSVEGWCKIDDLSVNQGFIRQFGSDGVVFRYVSHQGGKFKISGPGATSSDKDISVSSLLTEGKWFHTAFTWDASEKAYRFYLNGEQIAKVSDTNYVLEAVSSPFQFGSLTGGLDEIRISNAAREYAVPGVPESPESLYHEWLELNPTLVNTNMSANPDGDALNNLYEYALGGNPMDESDVGNSAASQTLEDNGSFLEYVYAKRIDAAARGLTYHLETSINLLLGLWTNANYIVLGTGEEAFGAGFNAVTNRVSTEEERAQFIRLQIEFTP